MSSTNIQVWKQVYLQSRKLFYQPDVSQKTTSGVICLASQTIGQTRWFHLLINCPRTFYTQVTHYLFVPTAITTSVKFVFQINACGPSLDSIHFQWNTELYLKQFQVLKFIFGHLLDFVLANHQTKLGHSEYVKQMSCVIDQLSAPTSLYCEAGD